MKQKASGVRQAAATVGESPTTPTTGASRPARATVRRQWGRVSMRPSAGSTRSASWCSQPAWFSSEPRWWSTLKSTAPVSSAAAPEVDGRLAAPGPDLDAARRARRRPRPARTGRLEQGHALVVGHEPRVGPGEGDQLGAAGRRSAHQTSVETL